MIFLDPWWKRYLRHFFSILFYTIILGIPAISIAYGLMEDVVVWIIWGLLMYLMYLACALSVVL